MVLLILFSPEAFCADLVALDFPELALALLNGVSQAETVALLTGTLWKMALLPEARQRLAEGLDALLHSLQTFPLHAGIQRNALGALFNVSLSGRGGGADLRDGSLPQRLLSRLALPVILDSLDALRSDGAVALQGVSLLQSLMKSGSADGTRRRRRLPRVPAGTRQFGNGDRSNAVSRAGDAGAGHVAALSGHGDDDAWVRGGGWSVESGRTQLAQSPEMVAYLEHLLTQYDPAATDTGSIAKGILRKVSIGTLSGSSSVCSSNPNYCEEECHDSRKICTIVSTTWTRCGRRKMSGRKRRRRRTTRSKSGSLRESVTCRNNQKKVENDDLKSAAFTAPKKQKKKNQKGAKAAKSVIVWSVLMMTEWERKTSRSGERYTGVGGNGRIRGEGVTSR